MATRKRSFTGTFSRPAGEGPDSPEMPPSPPATFRPILITGGAPRIPVDAVRFLSVHATGTTAARLRSRLAGEGRAVDLLLGAHAAPSEPALRFDGREDLERELQRWIKVHPEGIVVMAAAVNDYTVERIESRTNGQIESHAPGGKVPSGADELVIRLKPAAKVVDRLRSWGLRGPLVAFKYEAADTVLASAQSLRARIGASLVVANSLDGSVQALVDAIRVQQFPDREALLVALAERLTELASR
jgi:phosphopantothenoylcysteine synthetase/decarboxylase